VCLVLGRQKSAKTLAAAAFLVTVASSVISSVIFQAADGPQVVALVLPYW
jgi:hypothetical protein